MEGKGREGKGAIASRVEMHIGLVCCVLYVCK